MTTVEIFFLAFLQGITEFLPVSSSGHLTFFEHIFGEWKKIKEQWTPHDLIAFNISVHLGTWGSLILFYFKDIFSILIGWKEDIKDKKIGKNSYLVYSIILITLVSGIIALFIKQFIHHFYSNLLYLSLFFLIMSIILYSLRFIYKRTSEKFNRFDITEIPIRFVLLIGVVQGIAVLPGISRSGITLTVAMFLGVKYHQVMKYVMLIGIPIIFLAFVSELSKFSFMSTQEIYHYFFGMMVAFGVGLVSLKIFGSLIDKKKIHYFSYYLLLLSMIIFFFGIK